MIFCSVAVLCNICIARTWCFAIYRYSQFFRLAFSSGVAMNTYCAWDTENGILSNFSISIYELNQNWLHACHCNASHCIKWLQTSPCNPAPWVHICAWHCILYYLRKTYQYFINKQTLIFTENIKIYGRRQSCVAETMTAVSQKSMEYFTFEIQKKNSIQSEFK